MQTEPEMDVFISYSSRDKDWVRGELLQRIEQAGLSAFIDFRDFTRGAPGIKEMERGVCECRKTLLVLTPDYIKSGWCEIESIMLQTLDPANRKLRLIPLLKAECEKPLRIGALTHIDFTDGADHDLAWRQLLTALGRPPEPQPPPEPQRGQWFLPHPYLMPPNFTGRLAEREMLNRWLEADAADPLLVLRALGGFVLQGADAQLELAKLALARGEGATALDHARQARRLATCDGPPDYTTRPPTTKPPRCWPS